MDLEHLDELSIHSFDEHPWNSVSPPNQNANDACVCVKCRRAIPEGEEKICCLNEIVVEGVPCNNTICAPCNADNYETHSSVTAPLSTTQHWYCSMGCFNNVQATLNVNNRDRAIKHNLDRLKVAAPSRWSELNTAICEARVLTQEQKHNIALPYLAKLILEYPELFESLTKAEG